MPANTCVCPECDVEIEVAEEDLVIGTELECPECEAGVVVKTVGPLTLAMGEDDDEEFEGEEDDDDSDLDEFDDEDDDDLEGDEDESDD